MKRSLLILFLSATLPTIGQQSTPQPTPLSKQLDQVMTTAFNKDGLGGVLLIARHGSIVYKKAIGKANMELNISLSDTNVFRIGSITKQFTAIAILQLMEKGLLQPEDDITRFLPDYPVHGYHISIANLLSHTSGIKDFADIQELSPDTRRRKSTPTELIDIFKDQPMEFAPGTQYKYSNSNYIILGYIIEKVSGQPYEQYIHDHIFVPLGMTHSWYDSPQQVIPGRVTGYVQTGPNTVANADYLDPSYAYAAGALLMTAEDLWKWHQGLYRYTILKKATLDRAFTPFTLSNGQQTKYGFGWEVDTLSGSLVIEHSGSINGFSAFELYLPAEDVFAVCFSNRMNIGTGGPATLAACITAEKKNTKEIQLTKQQMTRYLGVYKFKVDQPQASRMFIRDGKLFNQGDGAPSAWQLHFTTPKEFYMYEVFPNNHVFSFDSTGKVTGFVIHAPNYTSTITKVE